jgi:hypothetical protein
MAAISKTPTGNYKGVYTSQPIDSVVDFVNNSTGNGTPGPITASTLTAGTSTALTGTLKMTPQLVTAAGASQGTATAITSSLAIITVATSVSTHGVKLPVAATGLMVWLVNAATTFGVKPYPATGGKIGAASTNAADTTLAINKANLYIARNTTYWAVQRGA